MTEWIIWAVDPDDFESGRGKVATVHGTRGEGLARGCEAILDGWADVTVEGPFGRFYDLIDPAAVAR